MKLTPAAKSGLLLTAGAALATAGVFVLAGLGFALITAGFLLIAGEVLIDMSRDTR